MRNIHKYAKKIFLDKDVINASKLKSILKNNGERYFKAFDCKLNETLIIIDDNKCYLKLHNKYEFLNSHCDCAENLLSLITEDEFFSVLNDNYVFIVFTVDNYDGYELLDSINYITNDIDEALNAIDWNDNKLYITRMGAFIDIHI